MNISVCDLLTADMQCIGETGSPPGIKEKKRFRKLRYVQHLLVSKYIHLCKSAFRVFVCVHEYVQDSWGRCLSSGWVRAALNHSSTDTPHYRVSHHVLLLRQKGKRWGQKPRGGSYWVTERLINLSINQHLMR